jgi:hypothetical protein
MELVFLNRFAATVELKCMSTDFTQCFNILTQKKILRKEIEKWDYLGVDGRILKLFNNI